MSHTPYGYVIRDGAAYIDEEKAKRIRKLFDGYYSPIIDIETFNKAEEIRISRAASLGRIKELDAPPKPKGAVSINGTINMYSILYYAKGARKIF